MRNPSVTSPAPISTRRRDCRSSAANAKAGKSFSIAAIRRRPWPPTARIAERARKEKSATTTRGNTTRSAFPRSTPSMTAGETSSATHTDTSTRLSSLPIKTNAPAKKATAIQIPRISVELCPRPRNLGHSHMRG
jgi:hypothetical protein